MKHIDVVYKGDVIAVIESYTPDEKHPWRKYCYRIGYSRYFSDTAKNLNDMVKIYLDDQVDFDCLESELTFILKD